MRIGIVNDLVLAQEALRRLVASVPGYSVAWMAADGTTAVRLARQDRPDVILMDLVMPGVDGVEATRLIMLESPCPILVVTASVGGNIQLVLRALGHGGLDAVPTPVIGLDGQLTGGKDLLARLQRLERSRHVQHPPPQSLPTPPSFTVALPPLVALGASTGGPEALAQVLEGLPPTFPAAVVVIEHISAEFASDLADWLRGRSRLAVEVARAGTMPRVGVVSVAATNDHLVLRPGPCFQYVEEPIDYPYRPSVNAFFESLVAHWPRPGVAVLMTGMGTDGARGLAALRQAGWLTIAQDQATSIVYGMPRAAVELHAACRVVPLGEIAGAILARIGAGSRGPG